MPSFKTIRARAAKRKGGEAALMALLPKPVTAKALARITDDRILADMTKRIFSAGFAWSVIEKKWPDFELAFLGFEPKRLLAQPDEFWERLAGDPGIVRNAQKIMAVRANAQFISDIAREHGSFAKFLAAWPTSDQVGLLELLSKRGARLGGGTGQYFLRFIGKDTFVLSKDVVASLRDAGLNIAENPDVEKGSARDPGSIQRLGRRDRAIAHASLAYLRNVDRGESCRGDSGARNGPQGRPPGSRVARARALRTGKSAVALPRQIGRYATADVGTVADCSAGLPAMRSAAFSAIISTQALMCAETRSGIADASTTRSRSVPCTRNCGIDDRIRADSHDTGRGRMIGGRATLRIQSSISASVVIFGPGDVSTPRKR